MVHTLNLSAKIKQMLNEGVYDQNEIFKRLYPTYRGHYSTLRDKIAWVKNYA